MAYAIIDRRNEKLIKVAVRKGDLPKDAQGMVVDSKHLDSLDSKDIIHVYRAINKDKEFSGRVTPRLREELAETLEQKANRANFSRSSVENPVQVVWDLCESMRGSRRKDIIEAAVSKGVTEGTAKTQYQYWKTWDAAQGSKKSKKKDNH